MSFLQKFETGGRGLHKIQPGSRALLGAAIMAGLVLGGQAQAQFEQITDINPGGTSSAPQYLLEYDTGSGIALFFAATTAANGRELWVSGGLPVNTFELLDINPGSASSSPSELTHFNGLFYFAADDGVNGRELWVSDGTAAGTMMVADVAPFAASSDPEQLTVCGSYLFFTADDSVRGREVFRFDGVSTALVADIFPGSGGSNPLNLFCNPANDVLYFSASNGTTGQELYLYDAGALSLTSADINPGAPSSSPQYFASLGSQVLFAATRPAEGRELWGNTGTAAAPSLVRDIFPGTTDGNPTELTTYGSQVVFAAIGSTSINIEPWRSDGTLAGTVLIDNLRTGANNDSSPHNLRVANGLLFFAASVASPHAPEPFVYNGTAINGLGKIGSGNSGSFPAEFTAVGSNVYFSAQVTGQSGRELWVTQGTNATTALAQDINPGAADSAPHNLISAAGGLWFAANNGADGIELWHTTGVILAVELDSLSATAANDYSDVVVEWTTAAEIDNVGFHVYRAASDGSLTGRITNELIPAEASAANGASYSFTDPLPLSGPGDVRLYYLADVDLEGAVTFHGPVPVRIDASRGAAAVENWMQYSY